MVQRAAEAGLIMSVDELKQKVEHWRKEEELRSYMQLERVCILFAECELLKCLNKPCRFIKLHLSSDCFGSHGA
jgi:hypothetical protein